ncbi:MAG TPA: heme-binding protein [Kofleriaceae bacterium]|nr:heme-binding protein [Kofleriaceae bacterium]
MTTIVTPPAQVAGAMPSVFAHVPRPATIAHRAVTWRNLAALGGLIAAPLAAGYALSRATTVRRGVLAGGLTALALGAARLQLERWFTAEPAYVREGRLGDLELRRYGVRIEATAEVDVPGLEHALDRGYSRLTCYVCGTNRRGETLPRSAPVITAMRDGRYTVSFVMPPGRTLASLPTPAHPGVELREVPARTIAVLRFRGRFTRDNIAAHERALLEQVLDAGLAARGSVMFAAFDWPVTLPLLRRNELWIEVA